jgi:hypothetical protein
MYAEKTSSKGSFNNGDSSKMEVSHDCGQGSRFDSIWDAMPLSCGDIIYNTNKNFKDTCLTSQRNTEIA